MLINDGGASAYRAVSCGESHTCALRSDGRIVCFGDNAQGKCGGDAANEFVRMPIVVAPDTAFKQMAAGGVHTCALRSSDGRDM